MMCIINFKCDNNHIFEGLFDSTKHFKETNNKKELSCPLCDSNLIIRSSNLSILDSQNNFENDILDKVESEQILLDTKNIIHKIMKKIKNSDSKEGDKSNIDEEGTPYYRVNLLNKEIN